MIKDQKQPSRCAVEQVRWLEMARRQKDEAGRLRNKNPPLAFDRMLEAIGSVCIAAKTAAERVYKDTGDLKAALRRAAQVVEKFAQDLGED